MLIRNTTIEILCFDFGSYDIHLKWENLFYEVNFETPFCNERV